MFKVVKEVTIFIGVFLFLFLIMHMDQFIQHPIEHFKHLSDSSFGLFHPLYFSLLGYVVLYIIRAVVNGIKYLFTKKRS